MDEVCLLHGPYLASASDVIGHGALRCLVVVVDRSRVALGGVADRSRVALGGVVDRSRVALGCVVDRSRVALVGVVVHRDLQ